MLSHSDAVHPSHARASGLALCFYNQPAHRHALQDGEAGHSLACSLTIHIVLSMYGRRSGLSDSLALSAAAAADDDGDLSLASRALHSPTSSSSATFLRRSSSYGHGSPHLHATRKRRQTLTRANDLPTAVLPPDLLARTRAIVDSICVINFDLDVGPGEAQSCRLLLLSDAHCTTPEFDNCYPHASYNAKERSLIAFVGRDSRSSTYSPTSKRHRLTDPCFCFLSTSPPSLTTPRKAIHPLPSAGAYPA